MLLGRTAWRPAFAGYLANRLSLARVAAILLIAPASTLTSAATPGEAALVMDRALRAAEAQGFGGAVIAVHRGATIIRRGYGFADREARTPFTPATIAQIGSITKMFTGVAIAQLIAQGRIDPNATVGTYLREAPEPGRSLIINDILTHRSGLMDACADDFDRLTPARLVAYCLAQPLAHTPGENNYSNMGYSVMARIVETVSGQRWEDYLAQHVWRPLRLNSAGFRFRRAPRGAVFSNGYLNNAQQAVISTRIAALNGEDWALRGNGGMQASPDDMVRFFTALTGNNTAIDRRTREVMLSPHGPMSENVREGYGIFFRHDNQGRVWRMGHSGSDGVFFSYMAWYPQSETLLYFVGNNGETPVREALRAVLTSVQSISTN